MQIIQVTEENVHTWADLCNNLWPNHDVDEMTTDFYTGEYPYEYLAVQHNEYIGFLSFSVRNDYVEGKTKSGCTGYIEAIYVKPEYRKKRIARKLIEFAKNLAKEKGCTMLASDCELENDQSRIFHKKVGFSEVGVNVHFKIDL